MLSKYHPEEEKPLPLSRSRNTNPNHNPHPNPNSYLPQREEARRSGHAAARLVAHLGQLEGCLHDRPRRAGRDAAHEQGRRERSEWDGLSQSRDATLLARTARPGVRGEERGLLDAGARDDGHDAAVQADRAL